MSKKKPNSILKRGRPFSARLGKRLHSNKNLPLWSVLEHWITQPKCSELNLWPPCRNDWAKGNISFSFRDQVGTTKMSLSLDPSQWPRCTRNFSLTVYEQASPLTTFKICEMRYLFFNVFVSDVGEGQLKCLQAVIPGARHVGIQCFRLMITLRLLWCVWTQWHFGCAHLIPKGKRDVKIFRAPFLPLAVRYVSVLLCTAVRLAEKPIALRWQNNVEYAQLCLNRLNTHAKGLLLFMSGWTMVQQHLLHRHWLTEIQQGATSTQAAVTDGMLLWEE